MENTNHHAGSATGIDLAKLMDANPLAGAFKLALGTVALKDFDEATRIAEMAREALAATPQHSVTEQVVGSIRDDEAYRKLMAGLPLHQFYAVSDYLDSRAQPLASTAATQPEQASNETPELRELCLALRCAEFDSPYWHQVMGEMQAYINSRAALAIPASTAASEQQASVSEADERKNFEKAIRNITLACDKSFRREKGRKGGYIQYEMGIYWSIWQARAALSGRATIPSDADERALFDAFMQTPAPDDYDASVDDAWLIWQEAWRAALTHRATTASGEIGCGGTGKFNDEMPCLGCDACLREGATTATVSYTTARGEAATRYHESFKHAHPLPAQWRWSELWDAMLAAAPDIATTAADQQGDTARASESQAGIIGAPLDSYSPEDQAFFKFWYSHLKDEVMQPPLAETWHSTARYIWDAALAQQGAAQAQAGEDTRDAARYRWLATNQAYVAIHPHYQQFPKSQRTGWTVRLIHGDDSDFGNAIDAAMAAPATSGGGNG